MVFFKESNDPIRSIILEVYFDHYKKNYSKSDFTKEKIKYFFFNFYFFKSFFIVIFNFFKNLLNIFNKKPFYIFNVDSINFGQYVTAASLRNIETNKSNIIFFYNFIKNLILGINIYAATLRISNKASVVCLASDLSYLDGIMIDFFLKKKNVKVYFKISPFGLACASKNYDNINDFRKKNLRQNHIKIKDKKITDYMKNRLFDPEKNILNYSVISKEKIFLSKKSDRVNFIIYQHSFVDAQLSFGFDGFKSVYDWLLFTIKHINKNNKNKIYLKLHPNIHRKIKSNVPEMDKKVWSHLKRKLPHSINLIESTISNYIFLKSFDPKNTILISHHGNAVMEGAYLGFRSISSYNSLWSDNYSFSNLWKNKKEYHSLLNQCLKSLEYLKYPDETVNLFIKDCYLREAGVYSEKSYINIISKLSNISRQDIRRDPDIKLSLEIKQKMISEISNNIETF